jgi:RHS repeat-associated protein
VTAVFYPDGAIERKEYDIMGNILKETDPEGHITQKTYNFRGQPLSTYHPDGTQEHFIYNPNGTLQQQIHIDGSKTEYSYDLFDHPIRQQTYDHSGTLLKTLQAAYSPFHKLSETDGEGITTIYAYDFAGRKISEQRDTKTTKFFYDPQSFLSTTEESAFSTIHHHDNAGQPIEKRIETNGCLQSKENYTYNAAGERTQLITSHGTFETLYNTSGKPLSETNPLGFTTTHDYIFGKERIEITTDANQIQTVSIYDSRGRETERHLKNTSNATIDYTYQGAYLYGVNRNGLMFTYTARDLEGHLVQADLPHQLGSIIIERDKLSRWKHYDSPYYGSQFPKGAYDPVGNLLQYQYKDSLGTVNCAYQYDDLNQLIAENEHIYSFDSIHNRLKKDDQLHQVNTLSQILNDGHTEYQYDLDGNLTFDGHWHYQYDSQDRLISLENEHKRIEYEYDPFHRRLSKKVFIDGKQIKYERYLWDGDNEIGMANEKGEVEQLRLLGEGLGAEIGAAVLYEIKGKTYLPIHDHRGCVVSLIDVETKKPIESYRYSAYGEELTEGTFSPWRFSSKRVEGETGLLFFGRRYYHPILGRWITQDPQGFDDGPNLYAYLNNCPLIDIDPYGLFSRAQAISTALNFFGLSGAIMNLFGAGKPKNHATFEHNFSNKSSNFDLGRPALGCAKVYKLTSGSSSMSK